MAEESAFKEFLEKSEYITPHAAGMPEGTNLSGGDAAFDKKRVSLGLGSAGVGSRAGMRVLRVRSANVLNAHAVRRSAMFDGNILILSENMDQRAQFYHVCDVTDVHTLRRFDEEKDTGTQAAAVLIQPSSHGSRGSPMDGILMRAVVGGSSGPGTEKRTESEDNPSLLGAKNPKREGNSSMGATSSKDKE